MKIDLLKSIQSTPAAFLKMAALISRGFTHFGHCPEVKKLIRRTAAEIALFLRQLEDQASSKISVDTVTSRQIDKSNMGVEAALKTAQRIRSKYWRNVAAGKIESIK